MANPKVHLGVEQVICFYHGEYFRPQWPAGYPIFVAKAFELICSNERFIEATESKSENIQEFLNRKPICCWLTEDELIYAYKEADKGHDATLFPIKRCVRCKRNAQGGKWRKLVRFGTTERNPIYQNVGHVCFLCVARRRVL